MYEADRNGAELIIIILLLLFITHKIWVTNKQIYSLTHIHKLSFIYYYTDIINGIACDATYTPITAVFSNFHGLRFSHESHCRSEIQRNIENRISSCRSCTIYSKFGG